MLALHQLKLPTSLRKETWLCPGPAEQGSEYNYGVAIRLAV